MVLSNHVTGWAVLLALSILSLGAAIVAITLQRSALRSLDVFIISILISFLLNASIIVSIHIYVDTHDKIWPTTLCNMYIWMSFSFRAAELLFLTALSVDRSAIFHTSGKYSFKVTPVVALVVSCISLISVLLGSIPVTGLSRFRTMNAGNQCTYLADDIHIGFAITVAILELTFIVICFIILIDVMIQWSFIKKGSIFTVTPSTSDVTSHSRSVVKRTADLRQRSCDIALACDNCRVVCFVAGLLVVINHLPYIVS